MVGRRPPKKETIVSSPQAPTPDDELRAALTKVLELKALAEAAEAEVWGAEWTEDDINDANFGVVLSDKTKGGAG